eukprot:4777006-Ditylum_brightwellii.AAC.1
MDGVDSDFKDDDDSNYKDEGKEDIHDDGEYVSDLPSDHPSYCSMCKDTIYNQTRINLQEEESQDSLNTLREKGK